MTMMTGHLYQMVVCSSGSKWAAGWISSLWDLKRLRGTWYGYTNWSAGIFMKFWLVDAYGERLWHNFWFLWAGLWSKIEREDLRTCSSKEKLEKCPKYCKRNCTASCLNLLQFIHLLQRPWCVDYRAHLSLKFKHFILLLSCSAGYNLWARAICLKLSFPWMSSEIL